MKKLLTIACILTTVCIIPLRAQRGDYKKFYKAAETYQKAPNKTAAMANDVIKLLAAYDSSQAKKGKTVNIPAKEMAQRLYKDKEFKKALNTNPALIKRVGIVMIPVAPYKLPTTGIITIAALKTAMDDVDSATFPSTDAADKKEAAEKLVNKYKALLKKDKIEADKANTEALIKKYKEYTTTADKDLIKELAEALFYAKMDMSTLAKAKATIAMLNTLNKADKKTLEEMFVKAYIAANVDTLMKALDAAKLINELKKADKKAQGTNLVAKTDPQALKIANLKNKYILIKQLDDFIKEIAKTQGKTFTPTDSITTIANKLTGTTKTILEDAITSILVQDAPSLEKIKNIIKSIDSQALNKESKFKLTNIIIKKYKDTLLKPADLDNTKKDAVENIIRAVGKIAGVANAHTAAIDNTYFDTIKTNTSDNTKKILKAAWDKVNAPVPGGAPGGTVPPKPFKDMNLIEINAKYNNNDEIKKLKKEDVETITAASTLGAEIKNLLDEENLSNTQKNKLQIYVNIIKWSIGKSNSATLKTVWKEWLKEAKEDFTIQPTI